MNAILFDSNVNDSVRRQHLYKDQVFVFSSRPSSFALAEVARELIETAFAPLDPRDAQHSMAVVDYVAILAGLQLKFSHHRR